MGVSWSDEAEADLEKIKPIVKDQLRRNAEVTLPDIRACTGKVRVGNREIMWHRGITHEQERQEEWRSEEDDDGTQAWDYYLLFYRRRNSTEFEVLAVRSTRQMASWMQ
jgi:plasmid stabilization system protein ParE